MESKICPVCGNGFEGRANRLYCSNACKLKAFYSEKNQEDKPPQTFLRKFSKSEDVNMKENLFQDKGS